MSKEQLNTEPVSTRAEKKKTLDPVTFWTGFVLAVCVAMFILHLVSDKYTPYTSNGRVEAFTALTLLCTLFFSRQIFAGTAMSKTYLSGLTTFFILLGTSAMVEKVASIIFYLRIAQILFAGLFAIADLLLVGYLLHPDRRRLLPFSFQKSR